MPLLGVLGLAGGIYWYGHTQREAGRSEGRLEALELQEKQAERIVRVTDTVYLQAKAALGRLITRWDTLRKTDTQIVAVPGIPDSVIVYIPRPVADSVVQLCTQALNACDASLRARDSLLVLKDRHIKGLEALKSKRCKLGLGLGIGGGIDWQFKPTVMAGGFFGVMC